MAVASRYESAPLDAGSESFQAARQHRERLLESIHAFERALAAPAADPRWRGVTAQRLGELQRAFDEHMTVTEGRDGLYAALLAAAPRLTQAVSVLAREHALIKRVLEVLAERLADPGTTTHQVRSWASDLLRELSRHRQRGADLVYEAYAVDIGGET